MPIVSAAMDTVTEARLAIALARAGGIGIVHRNLSIADQVAEVDRVKRSQSGMIADPVTLPPTALVSDALGLMARYHISGVPITDADGRLVGLLTNRDLRFVEAATDGPSPRSCAGRRSSPRRSARRSRRPRRSSGSTGSRSCRSSTTPASCAASSRSRTSPRPPTSPWRPSTSAAACGWAPPSGSGDDGIERAEALVGAGVDVIVVDTAHGHNQARARHGEADQGRRSTSSSSPATWPPPRPSTRSAGVGADGVKAGIGAGAICTTRVVAGVGVPQVTAIHDCAEAAARHGVTVVADGGVQQSGDIAKAIAAGAHTVMLGSMLAGVDESPGEVVFDHGERYKEYRGMGSLGAMKARSFSKDRYFQDDVTEEQKLVPEGIEGRVPYKGPVAGVLLPARRRARGRRWATAGPRRSTSSGSAGRFVRITAAGLRECHPHDVTITKEAPNYWG